MSLWLLSLRKICMGTSVRHKPYAVLRWSPWGRHSSPVGWQSQPRPSRPSNTVLTLTSHTCRRSLGICERCTNAYEKTSEVGPRSVQGSSIEGVSSLGVSGRLKSESVFVAPVFAKFLRTFVGAARRERPLLVVAPEVPPSTHTQPSKTAPFWGTCI